MPLAICLGPEMLIVPLLLLMVLGAAGITLIVFTLKALMSWADARRERLAAED